MSDKKAIPGADDAAAGVDVLGTGWRFVEHLQHTKSLQSPQTDVFEPMTAIGGRHA